MSDDVSECDVSTGASVDNGAGVVNGDCEGVETMAIALMKITA